MPTKLQNKRANFIVIYGVNNLGKTTQFKRLCAALVGKKKDFLFLKYPIYELEPTGPILNRILRSPSEEDQKLTEYEIQFTFSKNRLDFQTTLITLLNNGITVVAEDYEGTGMSWGMVRGLSIEQVEELNSRNVKPDLAILLDGERFGNSIEKGHKNEDSGDKVWNLSREKHLFLANRYNWKIVNANQTEEAVHNDIWSLCEGYI